MVVDLSSGQALEWEQHLTTGLESGRVRREKNSASRIFCPLEGAVVDKNFRWKHLLFIEN